MQKVIPDVYKEGIKCSKEYFYPIISIKFIDFFRSILLLNILFQGREGS